MSPSTFLLDVSVSRLVRLETPGGSVEKMGPGQSGVGLQLAIFESRILVPHGGKWTS